MGQRLKQGSEQIRDASNRTGSLIQSQVQNACNKAMNLKSNLSNQINSNIGMARQQMQSTMHNMNNEAPMGLEQMMRFH